MNKFEKILSVIFGGSLIVLAFIFVFRSAPTAVGSVALANEYHSTTTRSIVSGITVPYSITTAITGTSTTQSGTLGSIVITGAAAGGINIYDGTSTQTNSQYGTSTLATIPNSAVAGTYTFDVQYYRGLVIEITGTAPTTTITYR